MRKTWLAGALAVSLAAALSASPAAAFNWSVGANAGFGIFMPDDIEAVGGGTVDLENVTEFAWPSSGITPGLRVGFTGEKGDHEFYVDTGLSFVGTKTAVAKEEIASSVLSLTGNYQYNFATGGGIAPYVTAGAGIIFERRKDERTDPIVDASATSGLFGGGVGIRHKMGNGHGTARLEVRVDRITEGKDGEELLVFQGNLVTVRVGFDLWDK